MNSIKRHPFVAIRATLARVVMLGTVLTLTATGVFLISDYLFRIGITPPRLLFIVLFGILFFFVSVGFAHAFWGFWVRRFRGTGSRVVRADNRLKSGESFRHAGKTALVFPVYNEEVQRVFAGIESVYQSLGRADPNHDVDIFILSDSNNPDNWVKEEMAWMQLCRKVNGFGRIYYRRRTRNTNRKAGNISDFCTKWAGDYAYMITMDADSILGGESILRLIGMMDRRPTAGLIQTAPRLFNGKSLFARIQQFSARFYGPVFLAGLDWWQGRHGNYWGHNAIIRLAPFMDYCDLPDLPGREPFGGKILSHDFVEAALMVKGGWEVLLAYDLEESWEEGPPSLIDHAKRDRRWMQGNLQHTWLLFARRIHLCNWLHLFMGIMGYLTSCIWLLFLLLNLWIEWLERSSRMTLFPVDGLIGDWWGLTVNQHGWLVFGYTLFLLLSPKWFALADIVMVRRLKEFGGLIRSFLSAILETVFFTLIAPILMLFHTKFFIWLLGGFSVNWTAQNREANGTSWREAFAVHSGHTLFGAGFLAISYWLNPHLFFWMLPINIGLVLSIPISVFSSSEKLGSWFANRKFFVVPEESRPPAILAELEPDMRDFDMIHHVFPGKDHGGITAAVVNPYVNALHVTLLNQPRVSDPGRTSREKGERLIAEGPQGFSKSDILEMLSDPGLMLRLHRHIWTRTASGGDAGWWRPHLERYRSSDWMKKRLWD